MNDIRNNNDNPNPDEMSEELRREFERDLKEYDGWNLTIEQVKADLIAAGMDPDKIVAETMAHLRRLHRQHGWPPMRSLGEESGEPPEAPKPPQ